MNGLSTVATGQNRIATPSFGEPQRAEFDTHYMQRLFDTGYTMAAQGYPWTPPGYARTEK